MTEIAMTYPTGSDTSKLRASWLAFGYAIAAAALRLKNRPVLRLMAMILTTVLVATTLLVSGHVNTLSLFSSVIVLAVNCCQILLMLWDFRPLALQGEAQLLHKLVFPNLTPTAFNGLIRIAEWRDGAPGDPIAIEGAPVTEITVLLTGHAEVERDGERIATLGAGAIIGEIGALSAQPFSSTIRLASHSRYLSWDKDRLDHFFACHPAIASGFERAFIARLEVPAFRPTSRPR